MIWPVATLAAFCSSIKVKRRRAQGTFTAESTDLLEFFTFPADKSAQMKLDSEYLDNEGEDSD